MWSNTPVPKNGNNNTPSIITIHNDIARSINVTAVLTDAATPAIEYKRIITPSIEPNPPGNAGIIPINVETRNTAAIIPRIRERQMLEIPRTLLTIQGTIPEMILLLPR